MQTIYVDVYFLINFGVDLLSIYFALIFLRIYSTPQRVLAASLIGALYAVLGALFIRRPEIMYPIALIILFLIVIISAKSVNAYRKLKFCIAFLLFQTLIGGAVYSLFCILNSLIKDFDFGEAGSENRGFLIMSLIILLTIGVLKLFISFFGNVRSEKSRRLEIKYKDRSVEFEALVDSGNLATDPFDKTPVMLITAELAKKIFDKDVLMFEKTENASLEEKKKIRIIPLSFGAHKKIFCGYKCDSVYAITGRGKEPIKAVLVVDNSVTSYGGFSALLPLAALEDITYGSD